MATLTKVGVPSLATPLLDASDKTSGLTAGEAIAAGDLCYIKSDGLIWRSTGAAANAAAKMRGVALMAAALGDAVTIARNCNLRYGSALTPGADLFVSATAGAIDDAATIGGTAPIGFVVDATRVHIFASRY